MNYSADEIMQFVEEEDVKFIRLGFCDIYGHPKNISIMPSELHRAFTQGICIDASAIPGFGCDVKSDLFLHPDPDTLAILPWRPEHGRVVRMYCTITYPDGSPFELDTRSILKKAIADAESEGVHFAFSTAAEFYLFKLDENGQPTDIPYDNASYMDIAPEDKGENVRREICLTIEQMGIIPEASHHEEGPGQNEIEFKYSDPLTAADNALTFSTVAKIIASRNGLHIDFSPKPLADKPGSGLHINISANSNKYERPMRAITAGIMDKIADMTLFLNPTDKSYERFGSFKAPKYISWGHANRSQLIRIPASATDVMRAELRSPDSMANPYLVLTLLIYAGLHGLRNNIELPEESTTNLYKTTAEESAKLTALPDSLYKAADICKNSAFIKNHLPAELIERYSNR